ncbi:Uncaracterized surface protein containing fasciclin (FAS1) repeats [Rubritalea squalenifaciens DSM 18772]|uniref:Uncaracterized surface protein containing fasciclin (FAS1) repeats n=1 Tax=Rubritalea squalenifaciens DSM 18772 TaxID=1123071 RepID=A0A1M6KNR7_9BACT|nr:fasciclin domain-containing protein [Rubritalea squalenifaciens]SHJ60643.1 Uncaracterized surface protein containing fasciclin (FAS1) repeats [Rubritalea squalenifaciens DSM 18772]
MKKLTKLTGMTIASMGLLTTGLMAEDPDSPVAEPDTPAAEPTLDEPTSDEPSAEEPSSEEPASEEKMKKQEEMTVVAIADGNKDFTTLVTAIRAAGLLEALNGDGPYTVFAPNNAAFEKLPEGTLADLLKPENKDKLAAILKYHVVPTKVMAENVNPMKIVTLEGHEFEITNNDGEIRVNDAKVIKTDIVGKNGVIHVIDTVIMPPVEDEQ